MVKEYRGNQVDVWMYGFEMISIYYGQKFVLIIAEENRDSNENN